MGYAFRSGKTVHFLNGMYATESETEIKELTEECKSGHENYYIDSAQTTIESEMMDPMAILIARIREEERAKLILATNPGRDMGGTAFTGRLEGIANSASINGMQAASNIQADAARGASTVIQVGSPTKK